MRTGVIAFAAGAVMSFLARTLTSGLAAAYVVVAMPIWGIVAKLGGDALANERWVIVLMTAVVHGLLLAGIIMSARLVFPRLRNTELGGNLFLVAAVLYGVLLSMVFLVKE
jgi:hypothetical protein